VYADRPRRGFLSPKQQVPSRLLQDFPKKNRELRNLKPPPLTGSLDRPLISASSQELKLSKKLQKLSSELKQKPGGNKPTTMLNLLAFKDGMKESYHKYGSISA
jgi:hypothetical protein